MYTAPFNYIKASSVKNAVALMEKHDDAKLLAGGHSLIPAMKLRLSQPGTLIDLSGLGKLRGIKKRGRTIVIGALTTHREIEHSSVLAQACPMLPETAAYIGDPAVRARGTVGGSLAHADPAADYPAVMLALGASLKIAGPKGERVVSAKDFFVDMFTTALGEHEILTEIHVPVHPRSSKMAYAKFSHPASRYALAGVACVVEIKGGVVESVSAAMTGSGPRATALDLKALKGKALTNANIQAACKKLAKASDLLGDHFASKEYRAHLVDVIAADALARATARKAPKRDKLEAIEGIGPKIAKALQAANITSFAALSRAPQDQLKAALEAAKLPFAPSLGTWSEQAALLAKGDKAGFEALTKKLNAGRRD